MDVEKGKDVSWAMKEFRNQTLLSSGSGISNGSIVGLLYRNLRIIDTSKRKVTGRL